MTEGSIIEIVERKKKKKRKQALKRKQELARRARERERARKEKLELERKRQMVKKKDIVPQYERKIEAQIADQPSQQGHTSLPIGLAIEDKLTEQKVVDSNNDSASAVHTNNSNNFTMTKGTSTQMQPAHDAQRGQTYQSTPSAAQISPQVQSDIEMSGKIRELMNNGSKEEFYDYFSKALRSRTIIYLPGLNPRNFKFPDYGYRRFIEHLIESKNFLRILVDLEDIQGVTFVRISDLIRPKDDPVDQNDSNIFSAELTFRGLEGLCDVLYRESAEFDMYENEWKHLNNLLGCFVQPEVKGRTTTWIINTEKSNLVITANNMGDQWIYKANIKIQPAEL